MWNRHKNKRWFLCDSKMIKKRLRVTDIFAPVQAGKRVLKGSTNWIMSRKTVHAFVSFLPLPTVHCKNVFWIWVKFDQHFLRYSSHDGKETSALVAQVRQFDCSWWKYHWCEWEVNVHIIIALIRRAILLHCVIAIVDFWLVCVSYLGKIFHALHCVIVRVHIVIICTCWCDRLLHIWTTLGNLRSFRFGVCSLACHCSVHVWKTWLPFKNTNLQSKKEQFLHCHSLFFFFFFFYSFPREISAFYLRWSGKNCSIIRGLFSFAGVCERAQGCHKAVTPLLI